MAWTRVRAVRIGKSGKKLKVCMHDQICFREVTLIVHRKELVEP